MQAYKTDKSCGCLVICLAVMCGGLPAGPSQHVPRAGPTTPLSDEAQQLKEEAFAIADRMRKDFPTSLRALAMAATVLDENGNTAEALKCWQQCLKLDPNHPEVHNGIGWIALRKGEYEEAVAQWRKTLELSPNMPGVHHRLAHALMGLGKMQQAAAALEEEVRINPNASSAYCLLGQAYLQLDKNEEAKKNYQRAVELDARASDAHYGLATALARLGQLPQSRNEMQKFQKMKAAHWKAYVDVRSRYDDAGTARRSLARTCTAAGRLYAYYRRGVDAEKLWRRAATLDPKNTPCRKLLSTLYQSTGRMPQARQVCEQLVRIEPNNPAHWLNLGSLRARSGQADAAAGDFRKAKALAEAAVRRKPVAANWYLLCLALDRTGNRAGALAAIRRAIQRDPGSAKYKQVLTLLEKRK